MVVMSTIGQLFAITLKRKRSAEESAALAGSVPSITTDHDHLYHSVGGDEDGGFLTSGLATTTRSRARLRTATNSSSGSGDVPIPALPPPEHSRHRGGKFGTISSTSELAKAHMNVINSNSNPIQTSQQQQQQQQQQTLFSEMDLFPGSNTVTTVPLPPPPTMLTANPTVALAPPPSTNNVSSTSGQSHLAASLDAIGLNKVYIHKWGLLVTSILCWNTL